MVAKIGFMVRSIPLALALIVIASVGVHRNSRGITDGTKPLGAAFQGPDRGAAGWFGDLLTERRGHDKSGDVGQRVQIRRPYVD